MKLGDFFTEQFTLLGVAVEDEHLGELLKDENIFKKEVPDELLGKWKAGFMTKDSAINNTEIREALKTEMIGQSMATVDGKLNDYAKTNYPDLKLDEAKGTFSRLDLLLQEITTRNIAALEKAQENAKTPVEAAKLQKDIEALNGELATLKDTTILKDEHQKVVDDYEQTLDSHARSSLFSGYTWANDKVDSNINQKFAASIFNETLTNNKLKLVRDNGSTKIVKEDGSDYYIDNKLVSPSTLADKVVADNGLLANSTDTSTTQQTTTTTTTASPDATEAQAESEGLTHQFDEPTV